jgi:hypothetical protein
LTREVVETDRDDQPTAGGERPASTRRALATARVAGSRVTEPAGSSDAGTTSDGAWGRTIETTWQIVQWDEDVPGEASA